MPIKLTLDEMEKVAYRAKYMPKGFQHAWGISRQKEAILDLDVVTHETACLDVFLARIRPNWEQRYNMALAHTAKSDLEETLRVLGFNYTQLLTHNPRRIHEILLDYSQGYYEGVQ